jgi:4-hydroxy-3-methylbut-2-enyl diphosphate reductase
MVRKVLLASPRGFCAGVERAIDTVERALELYGAPVYVRKQIVHNIHVVRDLRERGAIFVDDDSEVPSGATMVLSAHGVAPSVHHNAAARGLLTIDGTCPLVTKVHVQARRYASEGYFVEDVDALSFQQETKLAYVTQTTLSVDETADLIAALRRRFPEIRAPQREDICYATSNRQWAVKEMVGEVDLMLVIGSKNSSNSNRLVEIAKASGVASYLIDDESEIDETWLDGVSVVGITSGASVPERLVRSVCDWFGVRGVTDIAAHGFVEEGVQFRLPFELRS